MFPTLLRRLRESLLLLVVLISAGYQARATHLLGGEMSYRYLDANGPAANPFRYEITANIYYNGLYTQANPNGIAAPPAQIQFDLYSKTTTTRILIVSAPRVGSLGNPVYPPTPQGCAVQGPSQPFYLSKYVQVVNLPISFDGYYAVFSLSARNTTLTNINNPGGGTGGNVPLTLYVSMAPPLIYNRSPVFSDTAVAIVCQNDTTISLNNAVDPDGDRLVYSFGTPYGNVTNPGTFPPLPQSVPYNAGYSGTAPFGTGAGNFAIINANTGITKYGAKTNGLYGIAVDVAEYRTINGREVLIGTTRRDLQLVVSTCPPTPPPVLPPAVTTPRNYTIEEGQSLSIPITATQATGGHPLVMTVNSALLDGSGPFDATFNGSQGTVQPGNLTGTATATGSGSVSGTFVFNSACGTGRVTPYDLSVTVRDNGCGGKLTSDVFRITVNRAVAPADFSGPTTVCDRTTVRTYTATGPTSATYRWRVTGGIIASGQSTASISVTFPGIATTGSVSLKGISTSGCPTDSVFKNIEIRPLAVTVSATAPTICLGTSTTLSVAGQAGLTYSWTGGGQTSTATSITVSPTTTTTYTVTGTDGTCSTTATFTVTVTPPPTADAGPDRTICPNVTSPPLGGTPIAGATYTWSPALGLSNTTVANPTVTLPNLTGAAYVQVYTLTVTVGANCSNTGTVRVTVSAPAMADSGPALTVCPGVASLPLGTAALPGYTYSWSPATGLSNTTVAQPTITLPNNTSVPLAATYTVTATNANGCTATSTVVITVNPTLVINPGPTLSFCSGTTSAPLGGTAPPVPGATYSWSPTAGLSDPTSLHPTVTGTNLTGMPIVRTYTLTVTSDAGCAISSSVNVTINPAAVADAGPARATCPNTPVAIGGTPIAGTTYAWSPATGLSSSTGLNSTVTLPNPTNTPITATYTLTATTANGCVSTGTVIVTVNPPAIVNPGPDVAVCDRKQVMLGTPALPGYTYNWSPATSLSSATAAQPVFVGVNLTANPLTLTYTLTATSSNGCSNTAALVVTVNPRPAAGSIVGPTSVCPTVTGVAYLVPNPAAIDYRWLVVGGTVASGQGTPSITVNWLGANPSGAVKVYRLNAQGCSSDTTVLPVIINQRLQTVRPTGPGDIIAGAPLPHAVCQADGPYTYASGNFATGSSFSWTIIGGTQVSSSRNTVTISWSPVTVPTIGKVVATETSNPSGGICRGTSDTLRVLINPSPRLNLAIVAPARVCAGSGPATLSLPGGFAGSSYVFKFDGNTLAGMGSIRTLATLPAPGTYTLTAQEITAAPGSCVGPLYTTQFVVAPLPVAPVISGSGFVCNTATPQQYAIANPTAGATYQWTVIGGSVPTGSIGPQITITFNPTGPYSVSAVEVSATPNLCTGPPATRVVLPDSPTLSLTNVSVDATSNNRVIVSLLAPNSTNTPNPVRILRRVAGSGAAFAPVGSVAASATTFTDNNAVDASANSYEYQLDLTNGCGNLLPTTVAQTIHLTATPSAGPGGRDQGNVSLAWNSYVGFTVKGYEIYRRLDNGTSTLLASVPAANRTYVTTNTDPGRTATGLGFAENFRVVALSDDATARRSNSNETTANFANAITTYNIITPNRDGKNDVLVIDNIQLYPGNSLAIFNRWGREVYKTTNYQNNWGQDDGLAAGNYFYLLTLPDGTTRKNWFEVIK